MSSSLFLFESVGTYAISDSIMFSRANLFHVHKVMFAGLGDGEFSVT